MVGLGLPQSPVATCDHSQKLIRILTAVFVKRMLLWKKTREPLALASQRSTKVYQSPSPGGLGCCADCHGRIARYFLCFICNASTFYLCKLTNNAVPCHPHPECDCPTEEEQQRQPERFAHACALCAFIPPASQPFCEGT